jgi:hypothetical protein
LPLEYIQKLDLITDNGYNGNVYHCNVL